MSQVVSLNVSDEFVPAAAALSSLIADLIAKKDIASISADVLPNLVAAISGYAAFAADIKLVDNQVYLLRCILNAVEPAPVVAASVAP